MQDDHVPEIPGEILQRLNLNQEHIDDLSRYFAASLRQYMRNDFYRDVCEGAFVLIRKGMLVVLLYLAWKGSGGEHSWFEPIRKFFME